MDSCALFTDVSVDPQRRLGVGGYLLVPVAFLEVEADTIRQEGVAARLVTRRFSETSSTQLEVQTVLWALENLGAAFDGNLQIYTDSQCVAGLMARRAGLTTNNFVAKRSGQLLAHAALYQAYYSAHDRLDFQVIKVAGHSRASSQDGIARIFSYVDREVRKALSHWMGETHAGS